MKREGLKERGVKEERFMEREISGERGYYWREGLKKREVKRERS